MSTQSFAPDTLNVIELFAGAAGLAQGFSRSSHYATLALFDILQAAQKSYQKRYPNIVYKCCDVLNLTQDDITKVVNGKHIHGVLGGPPCQGFSAAGLRNPKHDKNALVGQYVSLVQQLRPDFLLMENVPQLLYHEQFVNLQRELGREYELAYTILNAAQYGTPQTRHRLFVIAYHKDLNVFPTWPAPTHGQLNQTIYSYRSKRLINFSHSTKEEILGVDSALQRELWQQKEVAFQEERVLQPLVTISDAISDLYPLVYPAEAMLYPQPSLTSYQQFLRRGSSRVTNHVPCVHKGNPLHIVKAMPEGGSLEDVSRELWPPKKSTYYSQAYGRLHRQALARTLTTFFRNAGSGRFYHYEEPRTLTVREAARIQGFDDSFEFLGTFSEQMQLVGNAVPLPLAEALGKHIYEQIGRQLLGKQELADLPALSH